MLMCADVLLMFYFHHLLFIHLWVEVPLVDGGLFVLALEDGLVGDLVQLDVVGVVVRPGWVVAPLHRGEIKKPQVKAAGFNPLVPRVQKNKNLQSWL